MPEALARVVPGSTRRLPSLALGLLLLLAAAPSFAAGPFSPMQLWEHGSRVGEIEDDGDVWMQGSRVGQVEADGDVWFQGSRIGEVEADGDVWFQGSRVGEVEPDGDLWLHGSRVGEIEADGDLWLSGSRWGEADGFRNTALDRRAVAAWLLLIRRVLPLQR